MHPMSTRLRSVVIGNAISQGGKQLCYDAADELDKLHAIVSRLPVTADGVPVVPGVDCVYDGNPNTHHCWGGAANAPDRKRLIPLQIRTSLYGDEPFVDGGVEWEEAYSTLDAALSAAESARAAKEATDVPD